MAGKRPYDDILMEHIRNARNYGAIEGASATASGANALCGDAMTVFVRMESGRIEHIAFQCECCGVSMASASIMTDELRGMSLDEVRGMDPRGVVESLGVPIGPARLKCALLGYKVLQGAVSGAAVGWPEEADVLAGAGGGGSAP